MPDVIEPNNIPIFAEFIKISLLKNAKFPMNNDIVKPTPESIATPIISMKLVFLGKCASCNLILMYENKDTPNAFPIKRDKAIFNAKVKSITTSLET